ncbi:hypothetical protein GF1_29990 [Desulfolithobacter dissulfuricans]|uniref:Uncharacterized protein n=1 Tax=Desulfolithobacter dissulfuricans TaxID=2795293 RepID=A0A915U3I0_9BACT|nr:hypothetical protein [Desulfolithobacter dissulfuricans]BCO10623.1 hypothetical protein GF1_29990 [Desulfolithobacter dissulfuricans]
MKNKKTLLFSVAITLILTWTMQTEARSLNHYSIDVEVVSDHRGELQQYPAPSTGRALRSYIAVRRDERYRIRIRNNSGERIGVVIAVDGRNIISGRRSDLCSNEPLYVLGPWATAEYSGWRTSLERESRFYFTNVSDSYAAAWGDRSAMGVIGVAVFPEKQRRHERRYSLPSDLSGRNHFRSQKRNFAGTGFGESAWSPARRVNFRAAGKPVLVKFIKYEWRRTLCRRGVIDCGSHHCQRQPGNRFWPEEKCAPGFAPPPIILWQLFP